MKQSNKSSSKRITLPTYLAYNATEPAQRLITTKFGYPRANNVKELQFRLAEIITKHPDGLRAVAQIHPDLQLMKHGMEGGKSLGKDGNYYSFSTSDIPYITADMGVEPTIMGDFDWGDIRIRPNSFYTADGGANAAGTKTIGAGSIILGVIALGAIFIALGERRVAH